MESVCKIEAWLTLLLSPQHHFLFSLLFKTESQTRISINLTPLFSSFSIFFLFSLIFILNLGKSSAITTSLLQEGEEGGKEGMRTKG